MPQCTCGTILGILATGYATCISSRYDIRLQVYMYLTFLGSIPAERCVHVPNISRNGFWGLNHKGW